MSPTYLTVDWTTLHTDACRLAAIVRPIAPWRGIVAVTRGGMVPAAIVARELDVRLIETVSVQTYDDEIRGEPTILKTPPAAADGQLFLVIDDLVDSGVTARAVRGLLPRAHLACLYAKPDGQSLADSWVRTVPQDTWIVFPWDVAPPVDTAPD